MSTGRRKFRQGHGSRSHSSVCLAIILLFVLAMTSGCAHVDPQPLSGPPISLPDSPQYWWYARFKIVWEPETEPKWYLDLLLARQVLQPVLEDLAGQLPLWRFHRRAARDAAGHRFSFIFYASPATAETVYTRLAADPLLQLLYDHHLLAEVLFDDPQDLKKPHIEDASDTNWSPAVQKSWPYFAMGVSQTWLQLITQLSEESPMPAGASDAGKLSDYYRQLSGKVDLVWQEEGRHAYLHHLNALFGYRPLVFWEKRFLKF